MTFRNKPKADTPLGELIAGRIDQAEYRRRLRAQAHRELRYEELDQRHPEADLEPVIVPRSPRRTATAYLLLGIFWVVAGFLIALLIAHLWPATPRPAQTTDLLPSRDLSAIVETSSAGLTGAPPSAGVGGAPTDTRIAGRLNPAIGREGDIAYADTRANYVAIPLGPGIRIRVCGPADCLEVTSTDAGPNRAMLLAGRIIDLDLNKWERVCGVDKVHGLCPGSWVRVTGPRLTLPPTDVTP